MRRFGTDKPDMRFGNEIQDITAVFEIQNSRYSRIQLKWWNYQLCEV